MHRYFLIVVARLLLLGAIALTPSSRGIASPAPQALPPGADWAQAQRYDIALGEFHYKPSKITLQQGKAYALRVENKGRFRHTFTAPAFFRTVVFRAGVATEAETSGSLSLGAGEVAEIDLVPLRAGTYALECTKPLHGLFGMAGDIVVH